MEGSTTIDIIMRCLAQQAASTIGDEPITITGITDMVTWRLLLREVSRSFSSMFMPPPLPGQPLKFTFYNYTLEIHGSITMPNAGTIQIFHQLITTLQINDTDKNTLP